MSSRGHLTLFYKDSHPSIIRTVPVLLKALSGEETGNMGQYPLPQCHSKPSCQWSLLILLQLLRRAGTWLCSEERKKMKCFIAVSPDGQSIWNVFLTHPKLILKHYQVEAWKEEETTFHVCLHTVCKCFPPTRLVFPIQLCISDPAKPFSPMWWAFFGILPSLSY